MSFDPLRNTIYGVSLAEIHNYRHDEQQRTEGAHPMSEREEREDMMRDTKPALVGVTWLSVPFTAQELRQLASVLEHDAIAYDKPHARAAVSRICAAAEQLPKEN